MKKVRTRLLSAVLTVAMLVSLMPAAFAASSYYGEIDSEGYCNLEETTFVNSKLYETGYYFEIVADDEDAPIIKIGRSDVEGELLYWNGSDEDYGDVTEVYFDASYGKYKDSSYDYTITVYDENQKRMGTETVRIYVDDYSSGVSSDGDFDAETDEYGVLNLDELIEEIYDFAGGEFKYGKPQWIRFTTRDGILDSEDDGTGEDMDDVWVEINSSGTALAKKYVYFLIDEDVDEAKIEFEVESDKQDDGLVYGTIYVDNYGTSSGSITYSCDYNSEVYFEGYDFEDLLSSGQILDYVTFTQPKSSTGTLYWDGYKLSSSDKLDSDDLDDVSFEPASGVTGNVSISFKLYYYKTKTSKNSTPMSGTVVISVADGTTITYSGAVDEEVYFDSEDFDDVCYDVNKKHLDYVKFSLPSSSKGTLYAVYTGSSKSNVAAKTSTKFYVDPDDDEYALDDVVFVPKTSGTVELTYTGYYTSGSSTKSYTGKVKITTTAGTLSAINYTVTGKNGVTFKASDFTAALKAKTSKTLSYVKFTLPKTTEGTLYYNGTTKVTASTQYKASGSTNSLDKVSFVPASTASGSVTIAYTAVDASGNTYNGTVVVKTFVGEDTVITYNTTGKAVAFSVADFINACAKKLNTTLSYVKFTLPSASQGTLYYGYGTVQQTRVSANSEYTASTYLAYVSFLPKAGFSGTATINYTGYDIAGDYYSGKIQVTVIPPTKSGYFTDANVSWVAPAADFLQANGVYSGMVSGNTLGVGTAITRGEVMQMIYNAFNLKYQVPSVTSNFTDVPGTHPYYIAINAGCKLGIAEGIGNGLFNPDAPITRQDACTLLYRAFTKLGLSMTAGTANDLKTFSDNAKVASYAVDGVAGMVKSGIIVGDQNGINPLGNLTRGEMSVIVHRAMTL